MGLPQFILLKSNHNNKYLRYRKEQDSNHAFLQFSQDEKDKNVEIQYLKFEVQESETVDGFVHVRSCYNNKYWVRKSADSPWIVAEADEPEEDPSKWNCTLFKPVPVDSGVADIISHAELVKPQKIRLVHIDHLGRHKARASKDLFVIGQEAEEEEEEEEEDDDDSFTSYNATADSLVVLPEYVAFMGHSEEYAALTTISRVTYLEFKTKDIGHVGVSHRLVQELVNNPQCIWVQNTSGGYWLDDAPYIVTDNPSQPLSILAGFTPIRLGGDQIALRFLNNNSNHFANCDAGRGMAHVLGVSASSIDQYAILRVVEPVLLREINDLTFNLGDSRIYNVQNMEKFRDARNNRSSVQQTGLFRISYSISRTTSWHDSISVSRTVSASWTSGIPYVGDFGVQISNETTQTVEWGAEDISSQNVDYEQTLTLPPMKRIVLKVIATRAQCDVPFTCHVRDTMAQGNVRPYTKTDGLFRGANEYNFDTEIIEEELPPLE